MVRAEIVSRLKEYETVETAARVRYRIRWKGSTVLAPEPKGARVPLYADRAALRETPLCTPRYL